MKFNFKLPRLPKLSELPKPSDIKLPLDMSKLEELDREHYRIAAWGLGALVVLMLIAGLSAFFLSLRGAEQTMVPDVRGLDLPQALVKLQDKELYPRLSLRYTDDPNDKGRIVDQRPLAGTITKAGQRINLWVSRGPAVDKVENFVGWDVNEVQIHLKSLFSSARPLVSVKEPVTYVFDKSPAGKVIAQKPLPDTQIDGPVTLELVVSRGPDKAQVTVPDLTGLPMAQALAVVQSANIPVDFAMRKPDGREKAGTVVSELPGPGTVLPPGGHVQATITTPETPKGSLSGIFERDLPEYPYPLKVSLEVLQPTGERLPILRVNHPGGKFSVPYLVPEKSILILSVLDREVSRVEVLGQ